MSLLVNGMNMTGVDLAAPDVVVKTINENWEFILLACDGIWDVLSNEEVLKFVRTRVAQQMPPELVRHVCRRTRKSARAFV